MNKFKDTLVIVCSGTGFTSLAVRFAEEKCNLEEKDYDLLAIPGSIHSLAITSRRLRLYKTVLEEQIEFLLEKHGLKHIFVLEHADCAWFKELSETDKGFFEKSQDDVFKETLQFLKSMLPRNTLIEAWRAYKKEEKVEFEKLN